MGCKVCDYNISAGTCPRCGFLVPVVIGDGAENQAYRKLAETRRNTILHNASLNLELFCYKMQEGVPTLIRTEKAETGKSLDQLENGQLTWFQGNIARFEHKSEIRVMLYSVAEGKENRRKLTLSLPAEQKSTRIGIRKKDFLNYQVIAGDEEQYTESEVFCLIG